MNAAGMVDEKILQIVRGVVFNILWCCNLLFTFFNRYLDFYTQVLFTYQHFFMCLEVEGPEDDR